jgi:hypothetical protein
LLGNEQYKNECIVGEIHGNAKENSRIVEWYDSGGWCPKSKRE